MFLSTHGIVSSSFEESVTFSNAKSIEFDGVSDYISLSSRTQNFTNFSLSFWCIVSNSSYKAIVGSSNTSNGGILYAIVQAGSTIRYRDSSTSWTSLTPNIADANWHHVLITYDNSSNTLKGYTDGSLTTTINPDYSSKSTQAHSFDRIGSYGTSAFFPNNIDELAVYDSVISIGDVWDGSGSPTDLTNTSPVHWWRMGDNDTYPTIYDNAGSNDGTMQGMTSANIVSDVPPSFTNTKSLEFDGVSDYVEVSDSDSLSFGDGSTDSSFSISAWVNMDNPNRFKIASKTGSFNEYEFGTTGGGGVSLSLYDNSTGGKLTRYGGGLSSYNGSWIHLAVTYNGSGSSNGIKGYLNGSLITLWFTSSSGTYTSMENTVQPLRIGADNTFYSEGKIDEVALFNSELSSSDVTSIYNSGSPDDISGMSNIVSFWRMGDNDTYPTIADNVGSNDGTMNGMTSANIVTDTP